MLNDPASLAIVIAFGFAAGWVLIQILYRSSYAGRRIIRKILCALGSHAPSGHFSPAVGGRNIMRCLYCDRVVREISVTKESIRRTK
jgi:hypothetical protein